MRPDCAVIATMHGKETVIAPLLQGALGLRTELPTDFDTDCFGTFSGDVPRVDTALATARAKIAAAFKQVPHAHIGIASEGSFGPHPLLPMIPIDSELLLLMDRRTGIEVIHLMRAHFGAALPVIMVTGSTMSGHETEARSEDFHLLLKPVIPTRLRALIAFKLGQR